MQLVIACEHLGVWHLFIFSQKNSLAGPESLSLPYVNQLHACKLVLIDTEVPSHCYRLPNSVTSRKEALGTTPHPPDLPEENSITFSTFFFTSS